MLSLNPLSENHAVTRAPAESKRKPGAQGEERADFGAYLAAMAQPLKPEARFDVPAMKMDPAPAEKTPALPHTPPPQSSDATPQNSAQKAGHEPASQTQPVAGTKEARENSEPAEVKGNKVQVTRNEKEFLELLGASAKHAVVAVSTEKKIVPARQGDNTTGPLKNPQLKASPSIKNETAAHTLTQLEKIPDLVLASSDGLKRLGEKLGIAFLSKVSEKLSEKQTKTESSTTQLRTEARAEQVITTTAARVQKTGDGAGQQGFDAQSNTRSARNFQTRNVSRETQQDVALSPSKGDLTAMLRPAQHDDKPATISNSFHTEIRLADPVTSTRGAETIRAAVENPAMRTDLLRQMSEVMTRAQVLVTDNQNAQFSVKLYPRELGRMEIDLKLVDGEIKGKIVVESEEVKNEMQNFLQNRENGASGQEVDLNRIDIEVRNGNQNAHNPERTPDADTLIKNLVTRAAAAVYEAPDMNSSSGSALYA